MTKKIQRRGVFFICLLPVALLVFDTFSGRLGVNPIEKITHFTGNWALYFLLITLSVTPLKKLSRNKLSFVNYRRMLGLFCFFYAVLHLTTYIVLDHFFDFILIYQDIIKRPYITFGAFSFAGLTILAITSVKRIVKKMGGKKWKRVHRLIFLIAPLVIIHFWLSLKADFREPILFTIVFLFLIMVRGISWSKRKSLRNTASSNYSDDSIQHKIS